MLTVLVTVTSLTEEGSLPARLVAAAILFVTDVKLSAIVIKVSKGVSRKGAKLAKKIRKLIKAIFA
jgi:hypothetical protein